MEILLSNYKLILGLIILVVAVVFSVYKWLSQPSSKQKEQLRAVLLEIVLLAEKTYGSGTGKVKLSFVYSELVSKFTYLRFIPFSVVEKLIEDALEEMRHLLESNPQVKLIVEGDK